MEERKIAVPAVDPLPAPSRVTIRLRHMPKADPRALKARADGPKDSVRTQDSFPAVVAVASVGDELRRFRQRGREGHRGGWSGNHGPRRVLRLRPLRALGCRARIRLVPTVAREPWKGDPARPRSVDHRRHHSDNRRRPVAPERRGTGGDRVDQDRVELLAGSRDRGGLAMEPVAAPIGRPGNENVP